MKKTKTQDTKKIAPGLEAIEKLEDFIVVNRLKPHTKIPSEKDLCEMWGVSRSTLRQAVEYLMEEDVIYRVKDKGIYVCPPRYERDMTGVDAMVRDLINQGNKVTKKIISMNIIEATKHISKKMKVKLGTKLYEIIRYRGINGVPCTIETSYIDAENFPDFLDYYSETASMDDIFTNIYHTIQTTGNEHIDVTYASEEEAKVLKIKEGTPLFYASGVSLDQNGDTVMYYKQLIRSDKFSFVSSVETEDKHGKERY